MAVKIPTRPSTTETRAGVTSTEIVPDKTAKATTTHSTSDPSKKKQNTTSLVVTISVKYTSVITNTMVVKIMHIFHVPS